MRKAEAVEQVARLSVHPFPVEARPKGDPVPAHRLAANHDIFGHIEVGEKARLLVNGSDAMYLCVTGVIKADRVAVEEYCPCVRLVYACEYLDEGGFARPVLPQDGVYFARKDLEMNVLQSMDATKGLRNMLNPYNRLFGAHRSFIVPGSASASTPGQP